MKRALGVIAIGLLLTACSGETTPNPSPASPATGLATFAEHGLVFEYPASWRVFHYQEVSSFSSLVAFLATVDVPDPCVRTANRIDCGRNYPLAPDSIVVTIRENGNPMFDMLDGRPAGGRPLTVGGLPAWLEPQAEGAGIGSDISPRWTIAVPGSVDNYYSIQAEIRGPNLVALQNQATALIDSIRYDPAVVPLPTDAAAGEAAAAKALASLASSSPTWRCFPPKPGSGQMLVTSLTSGPDLSKPQVAICTTRIEATPLQLWRLTLTLRLSQPDPAGGSGEKIIQWVNPDGTPGMTTGEPLTP